MYFERIPHFLIISSTNLFCSFFTQTLKDLPTETPLTGRKFSVSFVPVVALHVVVGGRAPQFHGLSRSWLLTHH